MSRRAALLTAAASSFLTPFLSSAVNVALPTIARELHLSALAMSWVATSYLLAAAVLLLPFGRLADIRGRKKVFITGLFVDACGATLAALSHSAAVLMTARVIQGVGGAMIFGTGVAILTSVFPAQERGKVLGINAATVYTGLSLGPFLGGVLTQHFGWRAMFVVAVILGLSAATVALTKLKGEWAGARGESFDLLGAVLYGPAVIALMYGFSLLPAARGGVLLAVGVGGLAVFAWWEARHEKPLLDVAMLIRNRVFAFSNLAAFVNYSATAGVVFLVNLYLQYLKGLTAQQAGVVLVAQPIMQAVFSPLAGRASDRIEPRVVSSVGMGLTALGIGALSFLGPETPLDTVVGCLMLLGLGFALFAAPNMNAVMSSVETRQYGVAAGTLGTMRLTGQMLSMGVVMLILSAYMGRAAITPETMGVYLKSMRAALGLFAVWCAGGVFASLARGKVH